jgi:hypothetical protein
MKSVAKPRCAKGQGCYHVRKLGSEKPSPVSHQGDLCEKCSNEAVTGVESPLEYAELFRTARLLFDAEVEGEYRIIPTLVFAANLGEMPHLREMRDGLAAVDDQDEAWMDMPNSTLPLTVQRFSRTP